MVDSVAARQRVRDRQTDRQSERHRAKLQWRRERDRREGERLIP